LLNQGVVFAPEGVGVGVVGEVGEEEWVEVGLEVEVAGEEVGSGLQAQGRVMMERDQPCHSTLSVMTL
jgi:hypothetical protein